VPIRHVGEVEAHEIDSQDRFFDSLKDDYPEFDDWWREKCVKQHRSCWVVYDNEQLAGLIVRKDEPGSDTDAVTKADKILKICTFKVAPDSRGVKLGELLLKQVLWYAQSNRYELAYLTTYEDQEALMELLEYYGFRNAGANANGEFIYERDFSAESKRVSTIRVLCSMMIRSGSVSRSRRTIMTRSILTFIGRSKQIFSVGHRALIRSPDRATRSAKSIFVAPSRIWDQQDRCFFSTRARPRIPRLRRSRRSASWRASHWQGLQKTSCN